MNNYDLTFKAAAEAANEFLLGDKPPRTAARAEKALLTYLKQDDGSQEFLMVIKIPILHMLGRIYFKQARFQDARRRLRDAYAMSLAFPGMIPAYEGNETIAAFVQNEIGLDLPVEMS
jgi:hypothetical protein